MTDLDQTARELLAAECAAAGNKNTAAVIASGNNAAVTQAAVSAIRAALLTAPPGWKLVPVQATDEQLAAGQRAWLADPLRRSSALYRAMVETAPEPTNAVTS